MKKQSNLPMPAMVSSMYTKLQHKCDREPQQHVLGSRGFRPFDHVIFPLAAMGLAFWAGKQFKETLDQGALESTAPHITSFQ